MTSQYYIKITLKEPDGTEKIVDVFKGSGMELAEAKQKAAGFFSNIYVHKEDEVALASVYTLYLPTDIKRIRLIPETIVKA
jgi:hypothetical protein